MNLEDCSPSGGLKGLRISWSRSAIHQVLWADTWKYQPTSTTFSVTWPTRKWIPFPQVLWLPHKVLYNTQHLTCAKMIVCGKMCDCISAFHYLSCFPLLLPSFLWLSWTREDNLGGLCPPSWQELTLKQQVYVKQFYPRGRWWLCWLAKEKKYIYSKRWCNKLIRSPLPQQPSFFITILVLENNHKAERWYFVENIEALFINIQNCLLVCLLTIYLQNHQLNWYIGVPPVI